MVKRFGASRPTIGQALRGLQEKGLIERRTGSGTYVLSGKGRETGSHSSLPQIGMILPSLRRTEIFESILGEIGTLGRSNDFDFWSGSTASPVNDAAMTPKDAEELCDRFMTAKRPTGGLRSFCEEQPCGDLVVTALNALRDRLTNPILPARTLRITPRIVVRESCGAFL